jgi:hypothetical protein
LVASQRRTKLDNINGRDSRAAEAVFAEGRGMMSNTTWEAKEIVENKMAFSL